MMAMAVVGLLAADDLFSFEGYASIWIGLMVWFVNFRMACEVFLSLSALAAEVP